MTGYTRFWDCEDCGERVESIDWPPKGDELCDRCYRRRDVRRAKEDAVTFGVGVLVLGRRIVPGAATVFIGQADASSTSGVSALEVPAFPGKPKVTGWG